MINIAAGHNTHAHATLNRTLTIAVAPFCARNWSRTCRGRPYLHKILQNAAGKGVRQTLKKNVEKCVGHVLQVEQAGLAAVLDLAAALANFRFFVARLREGVRGRRGELMFGL